MTDSLQATNLFLKLWSIILNAINWRKKSKLAVILIDMQPGYLKLLNKKERKRIIPNQIQVIRYCRLNSIPLIILEYAGEGATINILLKKAKKVPDLKILKKHYNSGFTNPELAKHLKRLGVGTVLLMGINADFCVKATGLGAIMHGLRIVTANSLIAGLPFHSKNNSSLWFLSNGLFADSHEEVLSKLA